MRTRLLVCFLLALVAPATAAAQPDAGGKPADAAPIELPPLPTVEDPKLAALSQPRCVVLSWQDAVAMARSRSTDLRLARAAVERARGGSRQAWAGVLPSINGRASVTRTLLESSEGDGTGTGGGSLAGRDPWSWGASITVTQPLIAPRAWHGIGTAHRFERYSELGIEDTERLLLAGVADSVVAVLAAERVADLNRAGLRAALESLELTKMRERLGAATSLDLVRVRQDAANARSAVVTGDEALRQTRDALGVAVGSTEACGVAPGFDITALAIGIRAACGTLPRIDDRADIALARGNVELAERDVTDVELSFSPTVDLQSTVSTGGGFGGGTASSWTISAVLSVPIWEGGARYGSLRVARAGVEEAQARLEDARRVASVDVARARRGVDVAEETRLVSTEARDLAADTERFARLGFAHGRGTSLDLVEAAQQRRQAEIQLALREFDVVAARVAALLATARCSATAGGVRPGR